MRNPEERAEAESRAKSHRHRRRPLQRSCHPGRSQRADDRLHAWACHQRPAGTGTSPDPAAGNADGLENARVSACSPSRETSPRTPRALEDAGAEAVEVRKPPQLADLDGLILPGGESTTFLKFLDRDGFLTALQQFVKQKPTFGTCAGCILLARHVSHPPQQSLAALDITVERNAYGRQIDSVHPDGRNQASRRPYGNGIYPCPSHCGRRPRRRRHGRARRLPCSGTPGQTCSPPPFTPSYPPTAVSISTL